MKLDKEFSSVLKGGERKGSWIYAVMPDSVKFFGTKGYVKVQGKIDGYPFETSFMAIGDGTHMMPVKSEIRAMIGKQKGDTVTIQLTERLS
jgi:hypothetical protein